MARKICYNSGMAQAVKIAEFMSFCVEMYAKSKHLSGSVVAAMLTKCDGFNYLRRGYDVLHTMGSEWLVEELDDYFRMRGVAA